VQPLEAAGKPFDPAFHQALEQVETDDLPEGTVIEEAQRGYLLHGKVLRPAMVRVAKRPALDDFADI
jgi:molecular chaperone GrpE